MGKGKDEGDDQKRHVLVPSYGLLVPESGDDTQHRQYQTQYVEYHGSFPVWHVMFQFAVLDAVAGIDIQSDA